MRWGRLFSRAWLNYQRIFCCLGVCWQDQRLIILLVVGQDMQITYNAVSIKWFVRSKGQHKMYIVLKGPELLLKISYISFTRCPNAFKVHIYTQMGLKANIKITKLLFLMPRGPEVLLTIMALLYQGSWCWRDLRSTYLTVAPSP